MKLFNPVILVHVALMLIAQKVMVQHLVGVGQTTQAIPILNASQSVL